MATAATPAPARPRRLRLRRRRRGRAGAGVAAVAVNPADGVGIVRAEGRAILHDRPHLRQILDTLAEAKPQGETNLVTTLHDLAERIRQRSLVIIISDR